jgi:hypothetical protein
MPPLPEMDEIFCKKPFKSSYFKFILANSSNNEGGGGAGVVAGNNLYAELRKEVQNLII